MNYSVIMTELGKVSLELQDLLEKESVSLKEHEDVLNHSRRANSLVVTYQQMAAWYKQDEYEQMISAMRTNIELADRLTIKIAKKEEHDDNY